MNRTLSIGPLNSASQGSAWSTALRARTANEAFTMAFDGRLARALRDRRVNDLSDRSIPHYRLSPAWWRRFRVESVLAAGTHHLNESNMPLVGNPSLSRFADEAAGYERLGVAAAVVFHGSDARDPRLSVELNEHSFFRDADPAWAKQLGDQARRNRESVRDVGLDTFVTTPDMLQHVDGARFLPISLSLRGWKCKNPPLERAVPRVLHRPSGRSAVTKGTSYIESVLNSLETRGLIEVCRTDVVPHTEMPALLNGVDVVIDQIQTGAYGVVAIEAMAAGRVVVGGVSEQTRSVMGDNIPVIDANPQTLAAVLDDILGERERFRDLAATGPAFVRKWHDGRAAASALDTWLTNTIVAPSPG